MEGDDRLAAQAAAVLGAAEVLDPGGCEREFLAMRAALRELDLVGSAVVRRAVGRILSEERPAVREVPGVVGGLQALAAAGGHGVVQLAAAMYVLGREPGWCRVRPACAACPVRPVCGHPQVTQGGANAPRLAPWWQRPPGEVEDEILVGEILGGRDSCERAAELLDRSQGLRSLLGSSWASLAGVSPRGRRRLLAAAELARRWSSRQLQVGQPYHSARQVHDHLGNLVRDQGQEMLFAMLLDGRNRVRRIVLVSRGTLTSSLAHPREVFACAIQERAAALILVHNHPSGDPSPSAEDDATTERMSAVGEIVGIRLLDHVILGDGRYVSYLELGRMPSPAGGGSTIVATRDRGRTTTRTERPGPDT